MTNKERIQSAENIGLPKGEKAASQRLALQEEGDIDIPSEEMSDGKLYAVSDGRTFWSLRGVDILRRIKEGRIDTGVVGTDVLLDRPFGFDRDIEARKIGSPICRFSLLAEEDSVEEVEMNMRRIRSYGPAMSFPTSMPNMLGMLAAARDLPIAPLDMEISGSVEAYARLTGIGRVADLVNTGNQAQKNGLVEVYKLLDIYPELVMGAGDENL